MLFLSVVAPCLISLCSASSEDLDKFFARVSAQIDGSSNSRDTSTLSHELFSNIECKRATSDADISLEHCFTEIHRLDGQLSINDIHWEAFPSLLMWRDSDRLDTIVDTVVRLFPKSACSNVTHQWEPSVLMISDKLSNEATQKVLDLCPDKKFALFNILVSEESYGGLTDGINRIWSRIDSDRLACLLTIPWLKPKYSQSLYLFVKTKLGIDEATRSGRMRYIRSQAYLKKYPKLSDFLTFEWTADTSDTDAMALLFDLASLDDHTSSYVVNKAIDNGKITIAKDLYNNCQTSSCKAFILNNLGWKNSSAAIDLVQDDNTDWSIQLSHNGQSLLEPFITHIESSITLDTTTNVTPLPKFWKAFWTAAFDIQRMAELYHTGTLYGIFWPITVHLLGQSEDEWCVPCAVAHLLQQYIVHTASHSSESEAYYSAVQYISSACILLEVLPQADTWYQQVVSTILEHEYTEAAAEIVKVRLGTITPAKFSYMPSHHSTVNEFDSLFTIQQQSEALAMLPVGLTNVELVKQHTDTEETWSTLKRHYVAIEKFELTVLKVLPYLVNGDQDIRTIPSRLLYTATILFKNGIISDSAFILWLMDKLNANPLTAIFTPCLDYAIYHFHAMHGTSEYTDIIDIASEFPRNWQSQFIWTIDFVQRHLMLNDIESLFKLRRTSPGGNFVNGLVLIQAYRHCPDSECFVFFYESATKHSRQLAASMPFCPPDLAEYVFNDMRLSMESPTHIITQKKQFESASLCTSAMSSSSCLSQLVGSYSDQPVTAELIKLITSEQIDEQGNFPLNIALKAAIVTSNKAVLQFLRENCRNDDAKNKPMLLDALDAKDWPLVSELFYFTYPNFNYGISKCTRQDLYFVRALDDTSLNQLDGRALPEDNPWRQLLASLQLHRAAIPKEKKCFSNVSFFLALASNCTTEDRCDYKKLVYVLDSILKEGFADIQSLTTYLVDAPMAKHTRALIKQCITSYFANATAFLYDRCHEVIDDETAMELAEMFMSDKKALYSINWDILAEYKEAWAKIERAKQLIEHNLARGKQQIEQKAMEQRMREEAEKAREAAERLEMEQEELAFAANKVKPAKQIDAPPGTTITGPNDDTQRLPIQNEQHQQSVNKIIKEEIPVSAHPLIWEDERHPNDQQGHQIQTRIDQLTNSHQSVKQESSIQSQPLNSTKHDVSDAVTIHLQTKRVASAIEHPIVHTERVDSQREEPQDNRLQELQSQVQSQIQLIRHDMPTVQSTNDDTDNSGSGTDDDESEEDNDIPPDSPGNDQDGPTLGHSAGHPNGPSNNGRKWKIHAKHRKRPVTKPSVPSVPPSNTLPGAATTAAKFAGSGSPLAASNAQSTAFSAFTAIAVIAFILAL